MALSNRKDEFTKVIAAYLLSIGLDPNLYGVVIGHQSNGEIILQLIDPQQVVNGVVIAPQESQSINLLRPRKVKKIQLLDSEGQALYDSEGHKLYLVIQGEYDELRPELAEPHLVLQESQQIAAQIFFRRYAIYGAYLDAFPWILKNKKWEDNNAWRDDKNWEEFDPDAQDYFDRAEALGGTFDATSVDPIYTEQYNKTITNALVKALKGNPDELGALTTALPGNITASNLWANKITEIYLFGGVSFNGLMTKLKYKTEQILINSGFNSSDYIPVGNTAGLYGDGLNMLFTDPIVAVAHNLFFGIYITSEYESEAFRTPIGIRRGNSIYSLTPRFDDNEEIGVNFAGTWLGQWPAQPVGFLTGGIFVGLLSYHKNGQDFVFSFGLPTAFTGNERIGIFGQAFDNFGADPSFLTPDSQLNASSVLAYYGLGLNTTENAYLSWCVNAWATLLGANTYTNPI